MKQPSQREATTLCANKRRNDGGTIRAAASFAAMQGVPVLKA
jgi:hypothetical protein